VHFVDEETDHGPIILQGAVVVGPEDTEETLARRILQVEHEIYPAAIQLFAEGRLAIEGRRVRIAGERMVPDRLLPGC
jgi:phosphoribosylglycinamide formyltransferase-1